MRKLLLVAAVAGAVCALPPAAAATNECRGLQVCVPVAGPWVVVPAKRAVPRAQVHFQLSCPRGYIAAGFDAELTDRSLDIAFLGTMGAPVNPGVSTAREAVFVGTYAGPTPRASSFRPHIGCMPASGGGSRTPTSAVFPPGRPIVRHVKDVSVRPGTRTVAAACAPSERILDAKSAVAFPGANPPSPAAMAGVTLRQTVSGDRTLVSVTAKVRALVQVMAVCGGGK